MLRFSRRATSCLIIIMICMLMISVSSAQEGTPSVIKKIILFHEDVSWDAIDQYARQWQSAGVVSLMRLPLVHGLMVLVPSTISSAVLANDARIVSVENNRRLSLQEAVSSPPLNATADGGAADGGAADGGAADGGAADGGAADGGAADGGAADGGAADGGAAQWGALFGSVGHETSDGSPLQSPPSWSFIQPVDLPSPGHRPWSILDLFGQPRTPRLLTDLFDPQRVPEVIGLALLTMAQKEKIRVAMFDTGVDFRHPSITGGVKGGIDLIHSGTGTLPWDDNGHGTHVAGTLCSRIKGTEFGMVPDVELYVVKMLDRYATGDIFNIIMGLHWAIEQDIDVVNMSISYKDSSPAVRRAIQKAYRAGLIMVAAAGNHSNWDAPVLGASADGGAADGGAGSNDGASLPRYSVMYPARYPEVIAVGASTTNGRMASFSNAGSEIDVTAPGIGIVSTDVGGGFGVCSGTSMAAPHVTGTIAMMLALNHHLSPEEVKHILRETAQSDIAELNLIGSLEFVRRLNQEEGQQKAFSREISKILERIYREDLKKELQAAGRTPWKTD